MWEKSNFLSTEAAGLSGTILVRMITGLAKHDKLGEAVAISGNGQFIAVSSPKNEDNGVLNLGKVGTNIPNPANCGCLRRHRFTVPM